MGQVAVAPNTRIRSRLAVLGDAAAATNTLIASGGAVTISGGTVSHTYTASGTFQIYQAGVLSAVNVTGGGSSAGGLSAGSNAVGAYTITVGGGGSVVLQYPTDGLLAGLYATGGTIAVNGNNIEHTFSSAGNFALASAGVINVSWTISATGTFDGSGSSGGPADKSAVCAVTVTSGTVVVSYPPGAYIPKPAITFKLFLFADTLNSILTDGNSISTWADQSGNGYNGVTSGSAGTANPTFKTNIINTTHHIARFNGTSSALDVTTSARPGTGAGELFAVFKIANDPPGVASKAGHVLQMGGDNTAAKISHLPFTDGNIYDAFGTTARKTVGNPATAMTSFHCYNVRTASGAYSAFLDATSLFSTGTNTVGFTQYGPYIGHANGSTDDRWLEGDIALIAVCDSVLSAGDRAVVQGWITAVYGITF